MHDLIGSRMENTRKKDIDEVDDQALNFALDDVLYHALKSKRVNILRKELIDFWSFAIAGERDFDVSIDTFQQFEPSHAIDVTFADNSVMMENVIRYTHDCDIRRARCMFYKWSQAKIQLLLQRLVCERTKKISFPKVSLVK